MHTWRLVLKTILAGILIQGLQAHAQSTITLLSPTGDGGFENGNTLAANGWTVQNYTTNNANKWFVGPVSTPSAGSRAAYISSDAAGATYNYNITARSKVMFWRDIVFPAGYYSVQLSFKIKVTGQSTFDDLSVFFQTGNTMPTVATQPGNSGGNAPTVTNATRVATLSVQGTSYVTQTFMLNAGNAAAATTRRLIFYWENDLSGGTQPPASIDEISVTACIPPELLTYADSFRCGPGAVNLHAEGLAGSSVNWYSAATGGNAVHTGNNYTTPALTTTTNYYVSAAAGSACESARRMVTAHVYPTPVVNLGNDINVCIDIPDSVLLDAGTFPAGSTYLWNDGNTNASRYAAQNGSYSIIVTDDHTCKGYDTVNVTLREKPTVHLGNDTNICNGGMVVLDAGPGQAAYIWNTGANTQTATIQSPGTFRVKVTNAAGCTKTDTIVITMSGEFPRIDDILISNDNNRTYSFEVDNPRHITMYDWDFGDNTPHSNDPSPTHTYANDGVYTVVLSLQSGCGYKTYTRAANTVGIDQRMNDNAGVEIFPNPARSKATIVVHNKLKLEQIELYDIKGRLLYKEMAGNETSHELNINQLSRGMYMIKIISDKGYVYKKLQLW